MKKHEINFLTNSGYCSDPTAMAILRRDEIERLRLSIRLAKGIFKRYGFEVVDRIILKEKETGRIYK